MLDKARFVSIGDRGLIRELPDEVARLTPDGWIRDARAGRFFDRWWRGEDETLELVTEALAAQVAKARGYTGDLYAESVPR